MHMPAIVVAFVLLAQVYGLVFCLVWRFKFWHHSRKGFVLITLVAFALTSKSLRSCFRRSDDPFVFRPKELVLLFVQLTAFFAQKGGVKIPPLLACFVVRNHCVSFMAYNVRCRLFFRLCPMVASNEAIEFFSML